MILSFVFDLSRPWPFGFSRRTWPLFAVALVAVLAILVPFDHALSQLATSQQKSVVDFFNEVTRWGESDWILIPAAVLLAISAVVAYFVPRRLAKLALIEMIEMYALILVGVGLPSLAANILKFLIGRSRPGVFDQVGTLGFHPVVNDFFYQSFPSGHTTTAFSLAIVLGFLAPRWFGVGIIYAVAIGLSRLVVGAHYPTDVVAAMALGTLGAYAARNFFASRRWGFKRLPNGRIVQRLPAATLRLARPLQRKAAR